MKNFLIGMVALASTGAVANGSATGKVKGYVINEAAVYVQIDSVTSNKAACNTTNRFAFRLDQNHSNAFLSSILAAKATDSTIILTGTGSCTVSSNSETLRKICTPGVPC